MAVHIAAKVKTRQVTKKYVIGEGIILNAVKNIIP